MNITPEHTRIVGLLGITGIAIVSVLTSENEGFQVASAAVGGIAGWLAGRAASTNITAQDANVSGSPVNVQEKNNVGSQGRTEGAAGGDGDLGAAGASLAVPMESGRSTVLGTDPSGHATFGASPGELPDSETLLRETAQT